MRLIELKQITNRIEYTLMNNIPIAIEFVSDKKIDL